MLGPTVYTFSIILAVLLAGLGLGSWIGSYLAQRSPRPGRLLGGCQLLLSAGIAWTALLLAKSLPYWPINPALSRSPWFNFQLDGLRCAWAVLPAACLWGASFPLALAAAAPRCNDPARLVGRVYAANTVGAVLGALVCSIFLVGWLGTQRVQQVLVGLSAASGLLMFLPRLTSLGGKWYCQQVEPQQPDAWKPGEFAGCPSRPDGHPLPLRGGEGKGEGADLNSSRSIQAHDSDLSSGACPRRRRAVGLDRAGGPLGIGRPRPFSASHAHRWREVIHG